MKKSLERKNQRTTPLGYNPNNAQGCRDSVCKPVCVRINQVSVKIYIAIGWNESNTKICCGCVKMREYDVALSFAGEDRHHAERLAELLRAEGYSVFYDEYELAKLWGKDLYVYLSSVYKDQADYCVMFLSEHYAQKMWTNHERESAQARAFEENQEYILPVRLDDTEIPGILPTVGYLDLRSMTIEEIHQVLVEKLSGTISRAATDESTNTTVQNDPNEVEAQPQDANGYFDQGNAYHSKRDYDHAIEAFNRAVELKPDFAEAYTNRGVAYTDKDDFTSAISDHTKAIALKSDYAEAYFNRGNVYHRNSDDDRAIADHTRAIELKPDYAAAYTNRGLAHQNKGDFDLAFKDHNKAIALKPDFAEAYFNRGGAYKSKNNYDYALADHTKAIELNPNFAAAYNHRGVVYLDKGDYDCAIVDFTTAIDLNPGFVDEAYYNRGLTYHKKGDYDSALVDYTKAIDLNPKFVDEVYYNRGRVWLYLREWEKAKSDLTAAMDREMDIITAFTNDYTSVPDFERRNGVKLPPDIAAMLTPQQ